MKTAIRIDVFESLEEATQYANLQNAIEGLQARVEQFGAAIWKSHLSDSVDQVAHNKAFEQGIFVVITEAD